MSTEHLTHIPPEVLRPLEVFLDGATFNLGDRFLCAVLTGDAATKQWTPGRSTLDLVLVLESFSLQTHDTLRTALTKAQSSIPLNLELLTRQDILRSADVFPLKFQALSTQHVLIRGSVNPLEGLQVSPAHIRLRAEQVVKSQMFYLRQVHLQALQEPEVLFEKLLGSLPSFLLAAQALLQIKGELEETSDLHVAQKTQEVLNLPEPILEDVLTLRRQPQALSAKQLHELYESYIDALTALAVTIDLLDEADVTPSDEEE